MLSTIGRGAFRAISGPPPARAAQLLPKLQISYALATYATNATSLKDQAKAAEPKLKEKETAKAKREAEAAKLKAAAQAKKATEKERAAAKKIKEQEKIAAQKIKEKEKKEKQRARAQAKKEKEKKQAQVKAAAQKIKDQALQKIVDEAAHIQHLASFLLEPPKPLAHVYAAVFFQQQNVSIMEARELLSNLSSYERSQYQEQAKENAAKNAVTNNAFVLSHTPLEIYNHNLAVKKLLQYKPFTSKSTVTRNKLIPKNKLKTIDDPRVPALPKNGYNIFTSKTIVGAGKAGVLKAAESWKTMTPEQKEVSCCLVLV